MVSGGASLVSTQAISKGHEPTGWFASTSENEKQGKAKLRRGTTAKQSQAKKHVADHRLPLQPSERASRIVAGCCAVAPGKLAARSPDLVPLSFFSPVFSSFDNHRHQTARQYLWVEIRIAVWECRKTEQLQTIFLSKLRRLPRCDWTAWMLCWPRPVRIKQESKHGAIIVTCQPTFTHCHFQPETKKGGAASSPSLSSLPIVCLPLLPSDHRQFASLLNLIDPISPLRHRPRAANRSSNSSELPPILLSQRTAQPARPPFHLVTRSKEPVRGISGQLDPRKVAAHIRSHPSPVLRRDHIRLACLFESDPRHIRQHRRYPKSCLVLHRRCSTTLRRTFRIAHIPIGLLDPIIHI